MKGDNAHHAQNEHAKAVTQAEPKDAPTQFAIAGGETVTIATVTLGSLLSSLFVTNTAPSAPTLATWVFPGVLQAVYGDYSLITIRFESRQYAPSQIRVT